MTLNAVLGDFFAQLAGCLARFLSAHLGAHLSSMISEKSHLPFLITPCHNHPFISVVAVITHHICLLFMFPSLETLWIQGPDLGCYVFNTGHSSWCTGTEYILVQRENIWGGETLLRAPPKSGVQSWVNAEFMAHYHYWSWIPFHLLSPFMPSLTLSQAYT